MSCGIFDTGILSIVTLTCYLRLHRIALGDILRKLRCLVWDSTPKLTSSSKTPWHGSASVIAGPFVTGVLFDVCMNKLLSKQSVVSAWSLYKAHATSPHYDDVIMGAMAAQITSLTVVYSTVYSGADQRKHQSSAALAFVCGIHRDRWIPRTMGQLRGKRFHLMTSSCARNSSPVNYPHKGQWRRALMFSLICV